ncbi:tetratricopeptide repeat protein [Deinococcus cellulosilyticus]|nr:tetratricopeptide repeat protein [Deinococcus cellulosilyticus]
MPIEELLAKAKSLLHVDFSQALKISLSAAQRALQEHNNQHYASAMLYAGTSAFHQGDLLSAEKYLTQALNHFQHKHKSDEQIDALITIGHIYRDQGKYDYAHGMFTHALYLSREHQNPEMEADALNGLAGIYHYQGDYQKSIEALEIALPIRERLGNPAKTAAVLNNLGQSYTQLGEYFESLMYLTKGHQIISQTQHEPRIEGASLVSIGNLYKDLGDYDESLKFFKEAISVGERGKTPIITAVATENLGEVLRLRGHTREALDALQKSLDLSRKLGYQPGVINSLISMANVYHWQGNHKLALTTFRDALTLSRQTNHREGEIDALIGVGKQLLAARKGHEALDYLNQALQLAEDSKRKKSIASIHSCLAECYEILGNPRAALEHFKTFHKIDQELKSEEGERRSRYLKMRFDLERSEQRAEMYRMQNETNELARKAAEALVHERTQELEQAQVEIVTRLAIAAESRDDVTGAHTWRVGRNAAMLAQEIGLPREEVEIIRLAARLHDVGKIGIPDSILMKHGVLTPEEYEHMKTHTIIGGRILSGGKSRLLQLAQEIAVSHHERWDGRGYPFGLLGETIPLSGRIVAVADVFDALTHRRPYKQAWSLKNALEELERHSGTHFDPRIVQAALKVFNTLKIVTEDAPEL